MHAITVRKISDDVFNKIRAECKKLGVSLNRYIVQCLENKIGTARPAEYNDLDDFFGSWTSQDAQAIKKITKKTRVIDKEIWQ